MSVQREAIFHFSNAGPYIHYAHTSDPRNTLLRTIPSGITRFAMIKHRDSEAREAAPRLNARRITSGSVDKRTDEEPRLFFTHFWMNDDAVELARGLRAALDRTNFQQNSMR